MKSLTATDVEGLSRESLLLALSAIAAAFAEALYSPLYAAFVESKGGGVLEAGITWGVYQIALGIVSLLSGYMLDRIKRHAFILWGGFIVAGFISMLFPFAKDVVQIAVLQFLLGIVWAVNTVVWDVYYSLFMNRKTAAFQWSMFEGGSKLAVGIGSVIGGIVVSIWGFTTLFLISGLINIITGIALFRERKRFAVVY